MSETHKELLKEIGGSGQEIIEKTLKENYLKSQDGTLEMINKHHLERQKQVLGFLLKQLGSALFSGESLASISLPVTIFEPQTHLERQAYGLTYAPHFLGKAGNIDDKFEQFKLTVAHFIASLQLGVNPQKPFDPLVGETFQGIAGDCKIFMEQILHYPSISAFQMLGQNFTLNGITKFTASISVNSVKSWKVGYLKVMYSNTNTMIVAHYPPGLMQGTAFGRRTFQFADKFYIFDIDNKYYAEIDFDSDNSFFKKQSNVSRDYFNGAIWRVNDSFVERLKKALSQPLVIPNMKFNEKEHAISKVEDIKGSWLEHIKIGDEMYWSYGEVWPEKLCYLENPLPSDSNFRLDVLHLRAGNEDQSQEHKKKLDEEERKDRKLKEQARKRRSK